MFKLILLFVILICSAHANELREQITATKLHIQELQVKLKKLEALEATLPHKTTQTKNKLITHAEFGFVSTSGNTNTTSYSLDLNHKKNWDKHLVEYSFDGQYGQDKNVKTKNKYLTELQYGYGITNKLSFDYLFGFKQDLFSGYKYQSYTGPGLKYKLIEVEKHSLSIEGNILYSQDEFDDALIQNYASLRSKAIYAFQVLDNLRFTQDLSYRSEIENSRNFFVLSKTALISKLSDMFSLGLSYKLDYTNIVLLDKQSADKTFSANLIVDY